MIRLVLWIFDRFSWLVRLAGADHAQFRVILQAKLTLDNRRQSVAFRTRSGSTSHTQAITLAFYAFMGVFVAILPARTESLLTGLTFLHTLSMFLVGMSLVADFTGVLIDTADVSILGPRPVSGRTMLAVRLAHVGTYLGSLALAFSAATLIGGAFYCHPLFPLLHLASLICSLLFVVFLVNVFYLAALRFTDAERFKDLIVYVQIVMMVLLVGGYQILPRLMDVQRLIELNISGGWWTYLYPPCWFAAPAELVFGKASTGTWCLTGQAVLIPAVGLLIVVRYLAPSFARRLIGMHSDDGGSPVAAADSPLTRTSWVKGSEVGRCEGGAARRAVSHGRLRGRPLRQRLADLLIGRGAARVGFDLVRSMAGNDRQFKLRVYPQFAFVFLWPVVMLIASEHPRELLANLGESKQYLFLLYLASFSLSAAIMLIQYSSQFEAAWIYYVLPLKRPGALMVGAMAALAVRFALPLFALFAVLLVPLVGAKVLADVLLALCLNGVVCLALALIAARHLPFSENVTAVQASGRFGRAFPLLLLPAGVGFAHYGLTRVPYGVWSGIVPAAGLCALLAWAYARLGWTRFGMGRSPAKG